MMQAVSYNDTLHACMNEKELSHLAEMTMKVVLRHPKGYSQYS